MLRTIQDSYEPVEPQMDNNLFLERLTGLAYTR
jgi:hypothetical protein